MSPSERSAALAKSLDEDMDFLIGRLSRLQKGLEKAADAKTGPIGSAIRNLQEARVNVRAAIVPRD